MGQRYLLWFRFDGSRFHGQARTGGTGYGALDLLAPVLNKVFHELNIHRLAVYPCSRTDSGVHVIRAPCVVNLFDQPQRVDFDRRYVVDKVNYYCNVFYPNSMEALDIHWVSPGFCARRHAVYRRYIYRLRKAKNWDLYAKYERIPSAHCFSERFHAWTIKPIFDPRKANDACAKLMGVHNMASFFKQPDRQRLPDELRKTTIKDMNLVRIVPGEPISGLPDENFDYFNMEVISRGFIREQIRRMARIVIKCGYDERYMKHLDIMLRYPDPRTFISLGHRAAGGKGLYLCDVAYDSDDYENPVPYYTHPIDDYDRAEADEEGAEAEI